MKNTPHFSALYLSRTHDTFSQQYGPSSSYLPALQNLLQQVDKKKLTKIFQDVKESNPWFRKYCQTKRISRIKIEDAISFENEFLRKCSGKIKLSEDRELRNSHPREHIDLSHQHQNNTSQSLCTSQVQSKQNHKEHQNDKASAKHSMIRLGYLTILHRLTTLQLSTFTSQTEYLHSLLIREESTLKSYGYTYLAIPASRHFGCGSEMRNNLSGLEEWEREQKRVGKFKAVGDKIRVEWKEIGRIEGWLQSILRKGQKEFQEV